MEIRKLQIGARIRTARLYKKWDMETLAKKLGTFSSAIAQWERGHIEPKQATIQKIAKITGFDWTWFYKE